ncbi:MAG: hypothetical protein WCL19_04155 [Verrucomicrobiota bacterium]
MNYTSQFLACGTCRDTMLAGGGDAAGWSIFFLLFVILAMLGAIVFFMRRISRREKLHFDPSLSDDYVPVSPTR